MIAPFSPINFEPRPVTYDGMLGDPLFEVLRYAEADPRYAGSGQYAPAEIRSLTDLGRVIIENAMGTEQNVDSRPVLSDFPEMSSFLPDVRHALQRAVLSEANGQKTGVR